MVAADLAPGRVRRGGRLRGRPAGIRRGARHRRARAGERRRTQRRPPEGALQHDARGPLRGHARRVADAQPGVRAPARRHAHAAAGSDLRRGLPPRRGGLHDHRGRPARGRSRRPSRTAGPAGWRCSSPTTSPRPSRRTRDTAAATAPDGRGVRFVHWTWDPDPADTSIRTEYAFVLRDPAGAVRVVQRDPPHRACSGATTGSPSSPTRASPHGRSRRRPREDRAPRVFFAGARPV